MVLGTRLQRLNTVSAHIPSMRPAPNLSFAVTAPIYAVAFFCVIITGWASDKFSQNRGLIIAGWLAVSFTCSTIVACVFDYTARYALLVFVASGVVTANAMSLAFASSSFGSMPQAVRGVSLATVNALANLAGVYGAYLFPAEDGPKYLKGFGVVAGLCGFAAMVYCAAHVLMRRYERSRP